MPRIPRIPSNFFATDFTMFFLTLKILERSLSFQYKNPILEVL